MRLSVQRITKAYPVSVSDVKEFIWECVHTLRLGVAFHPDTKFSEYIAKDRKRNRALMFTKDEAEALQEHWDMCLNYCKKININVRKLSLRVTQPVFDSKLK